MPEWLVGSDCVDLTLDAAVCVDGFDPLIVGTFICGQEKVGSRSFATPMLEASVLVLDLDPAGCA